MNVVIGVLVVLCELDVTRVISLVDAVVGLTLGLIAHVVVVVFVVAILHRIYVFGGILFTATSRFSSGATRSFTVCVHLSCFAQQVALIHREHA